MDPITNLPSEVVDIIFSRFSGRELLRFSLVSPEWYNFIGLSFECMNKMKIALRSDWDVFSKHNKRIMENGRMHRNILISAGLEDFYFIHDIVKRNQQWKSVEILEFKFPTTSSFKMFFRMMDTTVESLVLERVEIMNQNEALADFSFKRLKKLRVSRCDKTFLDMFNCCPSLESLTIRHCGNSFDDRNQFTDVLKAHKHLKLLHIDTELFKVIFATEVETLPFHLEELSITNFGDIVDVEKTEKSFVNFMNKQTKLKKLYLGDWFGGNALKTVFEIKSLKEVRMFYLPMIDWNTLDSLSNPSIELLDLVTTDIRNKVRIKIILKAAVNAKKLRLRSIDDELAQFLVVNLRNLKVISLVHTAECSVRRILPNVDFI